MSVSNRLVQDGGAILEKGRLCITVQLASTERSHALMGQQCRRVREVPGRRVFQSAMPVSNSLASTRVRADTRNAMPLRRSIRVNSCPFAVPFSAFAFIRGFDRSPPLGGRLMV